MFNLRVDVGDDVSDLSELSDIPEEERYDTEPPPTQVPCRTSEGVDTDYNMLSGTFILTPTTLMT